jgi:hypothetical protein
MCFSFRDFRYRVQNLGRIVGKCCKYVAVLYYFAVFCDFKRGRMGKK